MYNKKVRVRIYLRISHESTMVAGFEFQKTRIGPQNMLHSLDRTTMVK